MFFSRLLASAGALSLLLAPLAVANGASWDIPNVARNSGAIPGEFIVRLKDNVDVDALLAKHNLVKKQSYKNAIKGFSGKLSLAQQKKLLADPAVEFIEPDYIVTTMLPSYCRYFPPTFPGCGASSSSQQSSSSSSSEQPPSSSSLSSQPPTSSSSNSSQSSGISSSSSSPLSSPSTSSLSSAPSDVVVPTGVNRIDAEKSETANIDGNDDRVDVDVAVIDTGIDLTHSDLNVYYHQSFITGGSGNDDNGHGTHVAGTIGALDDGSGVVGVAPGARLWALKVLDRNGSGQMSDIIEAIDYAAQHADEIDVINMSLGCKCKSFALDSAISNAVNKGIVFAVAAGNSNKDAKGTSPANHAKVISVSAIADFNGLPGGGAKATCRTDQDDTLADFSNYGSVVDIAAPGVCITSTWKGKAYATISGTSMASPHVAGGAALYIAKNGKPTSASGVDNVRSALLNAGFPQSGSEGFTGDKDSFKEPLLNVSSF